MIDKGWLVESSSKVMRRFADRGDWDVAMRRESALEPGEYRYEPLP